MDEVEAAVSDVAVPEDEHPDDVDSSGDRPPPPLLQELGELFRTLAEKGGFWSIDLLQLIVSNML